jgi:hypothetical protein
MLLLQRALAECLIPSEERLTLLVGNIRCDLGIRDRLRFVVLRLPGEVLNGRLNLEQPLVVLRLLSDFHSVVTKTRGNQGVWVHYHSC